MFNRKLCYEEKSSNIFISSLEGKSEESSTKTNENNDFSNEEKNENNVLYLKLFNYYLIT